MRNVAAKHFVRQKSRREVQLGEGAKEIAEASPADETWNREWVLHHYRRALARVTETFRPESVAIFEALVDGRSAEEVAALHDTTAAAVYKVKQRIRDRLRELIEHQLRDEEFPECEPLDLPARDPSDD